MKLTPIFHYFSRIWKHHSRNNRWPHSLHILRVLWHPDKHFVFANYRRNIVEWPAGSCDEIRNRFPEERKRAKILE